MMNQAAQNYWQDFWKNDETTPFVDAWQFGTEADELARLVISGKKTATCSAYVLYELEGEQLPVVGDYGIILKSNDEPTAIIQTTAVSLIPMNEVPESFALAEGEGDGTYRHWWDAHEEFFTAALNEAGINFTEDMMLVCERFKVVDVKT